MLMKAQVFYNKTAKKLKIVDKEFLHFEGKKVQEETHIVPGKADQSAAALARPTNQRTRTGPGSRSCTET